MTSAPLKYPGGKHYLAQRLIALMPPHLMYVEPFFGGGAVLLARPPGRDWYRGGPGMPPTPEPMPSGLQGCVEVANDLDSELFNFWAVLRNAETLSELTRLVEATPFCEQTWETACAQPAGLLGDDDTPPRERLNVWGAWAYLVRVRLSRQALGRDFATISRNRTRRGKAEQVSAWLSAVEGLIDAHVRLRDVLLTNRDAVVLIGQQDGPKTFFYCDPPYVHSTRTTPGDYRHEMTDEQHVALLERLSRIEGKFMLSGYRCELYDDAAARHGWRRVDFEIDNKAAAGPTKPGRVESVWMNYDPPTKEPSC